MPPYELRVAYVNIEDAADGENLIKSLSVQLDGGRPTANAVRGELSVAELLTG